MLVRHCLVVVIVVQDSLPACPSEGPTNQESFLKSIQSKNSINRSVSFSYYSQFYFKMIESEGNILGRFVYKKLLNIGD